MNFEKSELHAVVREGYHILLRADAQLLLPTEQQQIRQFYERLSDTCMKWAEEVYGERLRKEYREMESVKEKSQFRTQRYLFSMGIPWEEGKWAAILCESTLTGQWKDPQKSYHRISHVWNTEEQTVLPFSQILETFGMHLEKQQLPFRPDGIYPQGEEMVFFRNITNQTRFLESRLPRTDGKNKKDFI